MGGKNFIWMIQIQIITIWIEYISCTRILRISKVKGDPKNKRIQKHIFDILVCIKNDFVCLPNHIDYLLWWTVLWTIRFLNHIDIFTNLLFVIRVNVSPHKKNSVILRIENTVSIHFLLKCTLLIFWIDWFQRNIINFFPLFAYFGENLKSMNRLIVLNRLVCAILNRELKFSKAPKNILIWTDISCSLNIVTIRISFNLSFKLESFFSFIFGTDFKLNFLKPIFYYENQQSFFTIILHNKMIFLFELPLFLHLSNPNNQPLFLFLL